MLPAANAAAAPPPDSGGRKQSGAADCSRAPTGGGPRPGVESWPRGSTEMAGVRRRRWSRGGGGGGCRTEDAGFEWGRGIGGKQGHVTQNGRGSPEARSQWAVHFGPTCQQR